MVRNKISKSIGIICKAKKMLNVSSLNTLYYSFVYPHLTYGIEVWGAASKCLIQSVEKFQKKIIRTRAIRDF